MARVRYLVAYDISDDRRLRAVHSCVKGFGYPLQYSVFVCDLDGSELIRLRWFLSDLIAHAEDRVAIVALGAADASRFEFLGVRPTLPQQGPAIL